MLICVHFKAMAHIKFQKSPGHSCVCYYFTYNNISSRSYNFYPFCSLCLFFMWVFVYIVFFFPTRLTVRCYGPIYFIIYVLHNILMLVFDVLVKSFVLLKSKLQHKHLKIQIILSLHIICLQIMISSGLDLIKFKLNIQFGDVLLKN